MVMAFYYYCWAQSLPHDGWPSSFACMAVSRARGRGYMYTWKKLTMASCLRFVVPDLPCTPHQPSGSQVVFPKRAFGKKNVVW